MRITNFLAILTVINLQQFTFCKLDPTYCAFNNDDFQLNTAAYKAYENDWLRTLLEMEHQQTRGIYRHDGFERCEDSLNTSYCYTLWVRASPSAQPYVAKQGCWTHPSARTPGECQLPKCGSLNSSWTDDAFVHFCCCRGSKCNIAENTVHPTRPDVHRVQQTTFRNLEEDDVRLDSRSTYCAFRSSGLVNGKLEMTSKETQNLGGTILHDGVTVKCDSDNDYCFSYFISDPANSSRITVSLQGCWMVVDEGIRNTCGSHICIPHEDSNRRNNSHFCCCRGNMCNNNISKDYIPILQRSTTDLVSPVLHDPSYKERTIVISLLSVFSLAIIILTLYLAYRFCFRPPVLSASTRNDAENPASPMFDINNLKISCLIVKGRFSEVWKGKLEEQDVAVKIYSPTYRQYYYNEKYIYSLPHMEHDNIMKFFGGEERILQDGNVQYLLVLEYVPDGTLMNYLKNNTMDWYTMCKMCLTLARGLAHLHAHIGPAGNFKSTVAHRDINSRNVLVKPDLSLVIADLGFCMTTMGSKLIHKGHIENAEQTSLTDVGTLRYMAPELLDGAVNLRDCEASLKQIDMYAFGLVMWEISSRCSDLYQGCPMPEFMLPYHSEAGSHPTFEEMQVLVSRNKVRPKFPEVWKDYNQAIHALKETMEECWDHDAEARLTALCVEERVLEMKSLWTHDNRHKVNKGLTPTINTALLSQVSSCNRSGYQGNGLTQWGGRCSSTDSSSGLVVAEGSSSALIINDIRNSVVTLSTGEQELSAAYEKDRHGSFSTSTMETVLATTPCENIQSLPKSQNINLHMIQSLPPNQGRNPTVERNTHKNSDEELAVVGNNLYRGLDQSRNDGFGNSDSIFDSFTDSIETSLMQNDTLNYTSSHHHRSYTVGNVERPKKVVNNRNSRLDNMNTSSAVAYASDSTSPKVNKSKEIGLFSHLALLSRLAFGCKFDGKKLDHDNQLSSTAGRSDADTSYDHVGRHNQIYEPVDTIETEVILSNFGAEVLPANKEINRSVSGTEMRVLHCSKSDFENTEGSEADMQCESLLMSRHRVAPYSKSTSDLSPTKGSKLPQMEDDFKKPRPCTLSLKGHNYTQMHCRSMSSLAKLKSISGKKHGKQSPVRLPLLNGYTQKNMKDVDTLHKRESLDQKNGHHSLIGDSSMSDSSQSDPANSCKSSQSLQQLSSITEYQFKKRYTDCTC